MARTPNTLTLQAATVITAAPADIHGPIPLEDTNWIVLYVDYVNGDETGVYVNWFYYPDLSGNGYLSREWTLAGTDWTAVEQRLYMTVTGHYEFRIDVRGRRIIKFTQHANGGTPTGTLAAKITMT